MVKRQKCENSQNAKKLKRSKPKNVLMVKTQKGKNSQNAKCENSQNAKM